MNKILKFVVDLILRIIADSRISALRILCVMTSTILWTMMSFLTDQWKFNFTYAAAVRNIWSGSTVALPLILIHVSDTLTGDYYMSSVGSVVFSVGLGLLSASTPPTSCISTEDVPKCAGIATSYLYAGLVLTIVGLGCLETSLSKFEIDDGEDYINNSKRRSDSFNFKESNPFPVVCTYSISSLITVAFLSLLILMYANVIKPWHTRLLIATVFVSLQTFHFITGKPRYGRHSDRPKTPGRSLIVTILRVLVVSTSKLCQPHPGNDQLYHGSSDAGEGDTVQDWKSTKGMKCLDKAAIILEKQKISGWALCSVMEVEQTKMVLRMFPLWTTCILVGVVSSIGDTYFLEQANHLDRGLGKLKIPLLGLLGCQKLAGWGIGKVFEKVTKKFEKKKLIHSSLGVAIAMVFSILCCVVAALVEKRRLHVVRSHNLVDKEDEAIPMSLFWLLPQFVFLGGVDTMFEQGNNGLSSRFPESVSRYVALSTTGINGIGRIGGVLSVYLAGRITRGENNASWFKSTLNQSRLDQYYWLLAAMSAIAFVAYVIAACWHYYRENSRSSVEGEEAEHPSLIETCHFCCCG